MAKGKQKGAKNGKKGGGGGGKKGKGQTFQYGDDKTLRKALANWGLQIVKVGADGNCLFRSFAEAHCGDQEEHGAYRNACCGYLREQRDIYENFVHIDETSNAKSSFDDGEDAWKSFEEYVEAMAEVELSALCSRYGVTAMVFRGDGNYYELSGFGAEVKDAAKQRCLMISHHDDVHFNAISMDGDSARPTTLLAVRQLLLGERAKELEAKGSAKRKEIKKPWEEEEEEEEEEQCEEEEGGTGRSVPEEVGDEVGGKKQRPKSKAERRRLKQLEKEAAERQKRERRRGAEQGEEDGERRGGGSSGGRSGAVEAEGMPDIKVIQL